MSDIGDDAISIDDGSVHCVHYHEVNAAEP